MSRRNSNLKQSAFTLMEVMISGALASMILVAAYICLNAGIQTRKTIDPRTEILQNARVAMDFMSADLRSACPLSTNYQFLGTQRTLGDLEADNLDFATHNYTPRRSGEGDFCEVSYWVDADPQTGQSALFRRRNPMIAVDPLSGGSREIIATGVLGVRLEYYDGYDWYSTWGDPTGGAKSQNSQKEHPNLVGMPEAVRITMVLDANPPPADTNSVSSASKTEPISKSASPPLIFQTVARLNLADRSQNTSSASSSDSGSGDNSGQTQPGGGGPGGPGGGIN